MSKFKNHKRLVLAFIVFVCVISVFLVVFLLSSWGGITQPIAFNHKIHAENDIACEDCHPNFMEHASSGRPDLETCAGCHEEPLTENKEEEKLLGFIQGGKEIEWNRLFHIPEDVYFSHRRHVSLGNLECSVCHGTIGESTKPPSKVRNLSMDKCMECHEDRQVDNDCIACHR